MVVFSVFSLAFPRMSSSPTKYFVPGLSITQILFGPAGVFKMPVGVSNKTVTINPCQ